MSKNCYLFLKRLMDVTFALVGLVFLSPLLLLLAIMVRQKLGNPVIFRQARAGKDGKPFVIYKFRTMTDERDQNDNLLPDEKRLTRFGVFLRSTSIDELPELWNVLKGEMSLVGPRPLFLSYVERYSPEQSRRLEALPGLTGWAQINGRNAVSWDDRFKMDVWYVDNRNLLLDIRILLITLFKVLKREGISREGQATMNEFMGTEAPDES